MSLEDFSKVARFLRDYDIERAAVIPDKMRCFTCFHVLADAQRAPCGCRFCRDCVDSMLERGVQFCPGASPLCAAALVSSCVSDYKANMKISQLSVTCPSPQCAHECPLVRLEDHLRVCSRSASRSDSSLPTDAGEMRGLASLMQCADCRLLADWVADLRAELVALKQDEQNGKNEMEILKKQLRTKAEQLEATGRLVEALERRLQAGEQEIRSMRERLARPEELAVPEEVAIRPIPPEVARGWRATGDDEPGGHEIVYTVTDVAAFRKKSYYGECSDFSYGGAERHKYQLVVWNSGSDLSCYLRLYASDRDDRARWPLEADLTIAVSSSGDPKATRSAMKFCQFDRPLDQSCRSSQMFVFSYSELEEAGLLADNAIVVSCLVEARR